MTMLICPDCRNENEIERIYCHDCGTKLDRSKLKKDKSVVQEEKPEETQKRIRRMFGGRSDIYKLHLPQDGQDPVGRMRGGWIALIDFTADRRARKKEVLRAATSN